MKTALAWMSVIAVGGLGGCGAGQIPRGNAGVILPEQGDYQVIMEGRSILGAEIRRITMLKGSLRFVEDAEVGGARYRTLKDEDRKSLWSVRWDDQDSSATWHVSHDEKSLLPTDRPSIDRPSEVILGYRCHWVDTRPGVQDIGQTQCVTTDGMALVEENWSRGGQRGMRAVSIIRGPARLAPGMPGDDPFDPQTWGFPVP